MTTRTIGTLEVTTLGLGCNNFGWKIDDAAAQRVVDAALDVGINHFDTAELYGEGASETFLGKALGKRRSDVLIASKFGFDDGGGRPERVRSSVEASLRRLGTDYLDLYYLHRPDADTPIADTLGALSRLVEAGKVREIACSGFSADQVAEAARVNSSAHFSALQNEYSLLVRDPETDGTLDVCQREGLAFVPYFPLKSGLLTGKYRKGQQAPEGSRLSGQSGHFSKQGDRLLTEENLDLVEKLIAFSEERGHSILDLAFAYLLAQPTVASVIAGATKPSQIEGNARAVEWTLSAEVVQSVRKLLRATTAKAPTQP